MQAVILAGGLGTRLKPFTDNHPKPMFKIQEKPFIDYLIDQISRWGITNVLLLLGYKSEEIIDHVKKLKVNRIKINYDVTPIEYDTGARLRHARNQIEDQFMLMYCDNYCPIDYEAAYDQYEKNQNLIQICAYKNIDSYTKNNLLYEGASVCAYDKSRKSDGLNGVDIGYALVKKQVLDLLPEANCNFEASVYPVLVSKGLLGCYAVEHRYYSIGSWERIELTKEFFKKKKVVFLDRDGTINKRAPKACYIENEDDFIWLPGAKEAIKLLKDNGYFIYLITNQPGIARGRLSMEILDKIHEKMLDNLNDIGACIDDIFICPHGWDEGCSCRKPKPGLIFEAQRKYSLNLSECFLIGDDERDIQAGNDAGIKNNYLLDENTDIMKAVLKILRDYQ